MFISDVFRFEMFRKPYFIRISLSSCYLYYLVFNYTMQDTPAPLVELSTQTTGDTTIVDEPVPLSFPAILRNSKLADRFAYLQVAAPARSTTSSSAQTKRIRINNEGKRWIRRKENGVFPFPYSGDVSAIPQAQPTT